MDKYHWKNSTNLKPSKFALFAKFWQAVKYIARNWQLQEYFLHASQQEINSNANYQSKQRS